MLKCPCCDSALPDTFENRLKLAHLGPQEHRIARAYRSWRRSTEVCEQLGISPVSQRVTLHHMKEKLETVGIVWEHNPQFGRNAQHRLVMIHD